MCRARKCIVYVHDNTFVVEICKLCNNLLTDALNRDGTVDGSVTTACVVVCTLRSSDGPMY